MEPANGKGLNYKLIQKKPLDFYDQVLNQDVIKKKVFKERDNTLDELQQDARDSYMKEENAEASYMLDAHNVSKMNRNTKNKPLKYQESVGKRGIGMLVNECIRHID